MRLLRFAVAGTSYGQAPVEEVITSKMRKKDPVGFHDERIEHDRWRNEPTHKELEEFFRVLSLCHSASLRQYRVRKRLKKKTIEEYDAEEPVEQCLLTFCSKSIGYKFLNRDNAQLLIDVHGHEEDYELKALIEGSYTRHITTIVVQNPANSRVFVYVKGLADEIIPLLKVDQPYYEATLDIIKRYDAEGLEAYICAKQELTEEQFDKWETVYHKALVISNQRELLLEAAASMIETELKLVGVAAVQRDISDIVDTPEYNKKHKHKTKFMKKVVSGSLFDPDALSHPTQAAPIPSPNASTSALASSNGISNVAAPVTPMHEYYDSLYAHQWTKPPSFKSKLSRAFHFSRSHSQLLPNIQALNDSQPYFLSSSISHGSILRMASFIDEAEEEDTSGDDEWNEGTFGLSLPSDHSYSFNPYSETTYDEHSTTSYSPHTPSPDNDDGAVTTVPRKGSVVGGILRAIRRKHSKEHENSDLSQHASSSASHSNQIFIDLGK